MMQARIQKWGNSPSHSHSQTLCPGGRLRAELDGDGLGIGGQVGFGVGETHLFAGRTVGSSYPGQSASGS